MKRTPLHDAHLRLDARMVDFAGWEMPLQYPSGINEEHIAVRQSCGLFDVSHMGEMRIEGPGAEDFLSYVALNDAARLKPGRAQYSMLANDEGGLIDDIYLYRLTSEAFMVVCNAGNRQAVADHLQQQGAAFECTVTDDSDSWALLALQGPGSAVLLERLVDVPLDGVRKNAVLDGHLDNRGVRLARTGYTGEDGFEIFCRPGDAEAIWEAVLTAGAVPCGLGARDTLRLEAGFPLYGHELDARSNPLCTPFAWVVKDKPFHGRERIWNGTCRRRLVGLKLAQRGIARQGYRLFHGDSVIGEVTSGTISPITREGIAMGWVDRQLAAPGQAMSVEIRGQKVPATVVDMPFIEG